MGYDAFLAAAVARDLDVLVRERGLIEVRVVLGSDILLVLGPRRDPAWVLLAGDPAPAVYGFSPANPRGPLGSEEGTAARVSLLTPTGPFPPLPGAAAFARLCEVRLAGRAAIRASCYLWERSVELEFGPREGLRGDGRPAYLVHEAGPRPTRVLLLEDNRRLVSSWPPVARGDAAASRLARGAGYSPPPAPWMPPDDLAADPNLFAEALRGADPNLFAEALRGVPVSEDPGRVARAILRSAPPLGPLVASTVARAAAEHGGPSLERLHEAFARAVSLYRHGCFEPCLLVPSSPPHLPVEVSAVKLDPGQGLARLDVPAGEALSAFHSATRLALARDRLAARVRRALRQARGKAARKAERRAGDLRKTGNAEDLRLKGELLLANLGRVEPGQDILEATDYRGGPVLIELDPRFSAAANARSYFDRYRKAKRAAAANAPRREADHELTWLQALEYDFERTLEGSGFRRDSDDKAPEAQAREPRPGVARGERDVSLERMWQSIMELGLVVSDLSDIEEVLSQAGQPSGRPARRSGSRPAGPVRYVTADGLTILAGRAARENVTLSLKTAGPDDLWFHVRGYAGSHVVLRLPSGLEREPPKTSVLQAAALAAHLSAARGGGKVSVDYTAARNLRRPKGAPPGMVLYDPHETVTVDTARVQLPRPVTDKD